MTKKKSRSWRMGLESSSTKFWTSVQQHTTCSTKLNEEYWIWMQRKIQSQVEKHHDTEYNSLCMLKNKSISRFASLSPNNGIYRLILYSSNIIWKTMRFLTMVSTFIYLRRDLYLKLTKKYFLLCHPLKFCWKVIGV